MMNIKVKPSVLLLLLLCFVALNLNAKPHSSLQMKMNWGAGLIYDHPVELQIEITSQVRSDALVFHLSFPQGVTLIEGKSAQNLSIKAGESIQLRFYVLVKKSSVGEIKADARMGEAGQVFFRAVKTLIVTPLVKRQKMKANDTGSLPYRYTEREGVKLREYQLP